MVVVVGLPKGTFMCDQCSMDFQTRPTCPYIKRFYMTLTITTTKLCKEPVQENTDYLFMKKLSLYLTSVDICTSNMSMTGENNDLAGLSVIIVLSHLLLHGYKKFIKALSIKV